MTHLLASLFFMLLIAGVAAFVVDLVRRDGARIVAALIGEEPTAAPRRWNARVRTVASPRPVSVRLMPRRAAA